MSKLADAGISWVIIGGQTSPAFFPPEAWIQEIEQAADMVGLPIFEKGNLRRTWLKPPRQEFPAGD